MSDDYIVKLIEARDEMIEMLKDDNFMRRKQEEHLLMVEAIAYVNVSLGKLSELSRINKK